MPQSYRTADHAPVLTSDEDVASASGVATATAPRESTEIFVVPDSPAALWTSASRRRYTAETVECVPAELRTWVAPVVVVRCHS
ncbi:MAG: hypothetical protein ACRDXX_03355 [Stackebrandtia sp.]